MGITDSMDVSLSELQELGDGQGGLVCCSPWGRKESDTTERLHSLKLYATSLLKTSPKASQGKPCSLTAASPAWLGSQHP